MRIQPNDTLALCIDFQEKLVPVMSQPQQVVNRASILLKGLEVLGVPALITRQYPKGLGDTVEEIAQSAPNTPQLDKLAFSCWQDEAIRSHIEAQGKKTILLCGIECHICVLQTALDLLEAGYQVVLAADATGSRKEEDKALGLQRFCQEGGRITSVEAILFELTQVAGTPQFKAISRLIK